MSTSPVAPVLTAAEPGASLLSMVNIVLRRWRLLVFLPLLFATVAVLMVLNRGRQYVASATFLPQAAAQSGGASGALGLARQFGLDLGGDPTGRSPEFFVDLLTRRALLRQAVQMEYAIPTEAGDRRADLVHYFGIDTTLTSPPAWHEAVEELRGRIDASANQETGIVQLSVMAPHPSVAEQIASHLLGLLNDFNLKVQQNRAEEEGRFVAARLEEAGALLAQAEQELQEFEQQNRQIGNSPELLFQHERLQRRVGMRQDVYTSLLQAHEQARLDEMRDTPVLTIIDQPLGVPLPRRLPVRAVLGLLIGLLIAILAAFASDAIDRDRESNTGQYREFNSIVREAWRDVSRPSRWFRSRTAQSAVPKQPAQRN